MAIEGVGLIAIGAGLAVGLSALAAGIALFQKVADAKIVSDIIDIYPEKPTLTTITLSEEKISTVVGVPIPLKKSVEILTNLGFALAISL